MKYIQTFESKKSKKNKIYNIRLDTFKLDIINAVVNDDEKRLKYLIRKGHNVNVQDSRGNTPLFYAAQHDLMNIIYILIDSGADWNIKNNKNYDFLFLLNDIQIENLKELYKEKYNDYLLRQEAEKKYNL